MPTLTRPRWGWCRSRRRRRRWRQSPPFALEPQCLVQRPGWWRQAPKPAPEAGQDTPETWEHSVEVQVPFLQKVLKNFKLLPVVVGEADPAQVAKALAAQIDDRTIVVASSDLSHYHTYQAAKGLDDRCVKAICDMDIDAMADAGSVRQGADPDAAAPGAAEGLEGAIARLPQQW